MDTIWNHHLDVIWDAYLDVSSDADIHVIWDAYLDFIWDAYFRRHSGTLAIQMCKAAALGASTGAATSSDTANGHFEKVQYTPNVTLKWRLQNGHFKIVPPKWRF